MYRVCFRHLELRTKVSQSRSALLPAAFPAPSAIVSLGGPYFSSRFALVDVPALLLCGLLELRRTYHRRLFCRMHPVRDPGRRPDPAGPSRREARIPDRCSPPFLSRSSPRRRHCRTPDKARSLFRPRHRTERPPSRDSGRRLPPDVHPRRCTPEPHGSFPSRWLFDDRDTSLEAVISYAPPPRARECHPAPPHGRPHRRSYSPGVAAPSAITPRERA